MRSSKENRLIAARPPTPTPATFQTPVSLNRELQYGVQDPGTVSQTRMIPDSTYGAAYRPNDVLDGSPRLTPTGTVKRRAPASCGRKGPCRNPVTSSVPIAPCSGPTTPCAASVRAYPAPITYGYPDRSGSLPK